MVKAKNKDQTATEVIHQEEPTEEPEVPGEETDAITQIADSLRAIAEKETVDKKTIDTLSKQIGGLSEASQKVLMDSPLMRDITEKASHSEDIVGNMKPGEAYKVGPISFKKPWRVDDLEQFERIPFSSTRREEWMWNGIRFVFEEDETYHIPEPFHTMIMTHRSDQKAARADIKNGFGMGFKQLSAEGWAGKEAEDKKGE